MIRSRSLFGLNDQIPQPFWTHTARHSRASQRSDPATFLESPPAFAVDSMVHLNQNHGPTTGLHIIPHIPVGSLFSSVASRHPSASASAPAPLSSHTSHLSHNSSHTTHLIHNSSPSSHTQLISSITHLLHSSHTQLISHNSSPATHLAWQAPYQPPDGAAARIVAGWAQYRSCGTVAGWAAAPLCVAGAVHRVL